MDREKVRALLNDVSRGALAPDDALRRLSDLPVADLGFARLDLHRSLRHGSPEAIFCLGKTPEQVVAIARHLARHHDNVLATRADVATLEAIAASEVPHRLHRLARIAVINPAPMAAVGLIVIISAGTADLPVVEEAAVVAETLGNRVERLSDCGVAGLHRLVPHLDLLHEASAVVVVAGMEGALPSVIGGLVDRPVIAVPTSDPVQGLAARRPRDHRHARVRGGSAHRPRQGAARARGPRLRSRRGAPPPRSVRGALGGHLDPFGITLNHQTTSRTPKGAGCPSGE